MSGEPTFTEASFRAFYLLDTRGVPLALQIEENRRRGRATSLPAFYLDGIRAGWSRERALAACAEAMVDTGADSDRIERSVAFLRGLG